MYRIQIFKKKSKFDFEKNFTAAGDKVGADCEVALVTNAHIYVSSGMHSKIKISKKNGKILRKQYSHICVLQRSLCN